MLARLCPNEASDYSLIAIKSGADKDGDEVTECLNTSTTMGYAFRKVKSSLILIADFQAIDYV